MLRKKILFLSSWFPIPANNGSKLRIYNLLRGLSQYYEIFLISFDDQSNPENHIPEIKSICAEVQTVPLRPYNPKSFKALMGYFSLSPRAMIDSYSPEMAHRIQETVSIQKPDIIIASQLGTARYARSFGRVPAIFEEVEIGLVHDRYLYAGNLLKRFRNGLTWMKHRRYLANLLHDFQACTVVSVREKERLLSINPGNAKIEIVPNCISVNDYQEVKEFPQPGTLIFTGSFSFKPNYEAMTWFLEKVYPQIKAQFPTVKMTITGDHGNRPLPPLKDVVLTGFVGDVRPLIARSWISVVPILSGGGTRLKILEAMALHTPVVTTHKGAEGLEVEHGQNILIADTPGEFAENIIKLLNDPETRQRLAHNAYQLVQNEYEWSVVMPRFINLVETTIENHHRK